MTDVLSPEQRHRCMSSIRSKDTKPEKIVRKYLFSKGLRYRIGSRKLPGSPDIVLRKYKTVIFVDGCFWHGHEGCKYYRLPKTNEDFWRQKIYLNIARDYRCNVELRLAGWKVIRIWECEVRNKSGREEVLERLYNEITGCSNETPLNPSVHGPDQTSDVKPPVAAEPETPYGPSSAEPD